MKKILLLSVLCISILSSCQKYREFEDLEITENSYSGNILINPDLGGDIDIDIRGNDDTGTQSFIWDNPGRLAVLSLKNTERPILDGQVIIVIEDASGEEVLNENVVTDEENNFAQASTRGKKGKWKVTITLNNFNGNAIFDLNP